jgi:hypothetical protein
VNRATDVRLWSLAEGYRHPHLIESEPGIHEPPAPECINTFIRGKKVVAFPVAARKFQFHDFVMRASVLPCDTDFGDDEEDKKKLGATSNVVFEYSGELSNTVENCRTLMISLVRWMPCTQVGST